MTMENIKKIILDYHRKTRLPKRHMLKQLWFNTLSHQDFYQNIDLTKNTPSTLNTTIFLIYRVQDFFSSEKHFNFNIMFLKTTVSKITGHLCNNIFVRIIIRVSDTYFNRLSCAYNMFLSNQSNPNHRRKFKSRKSLSSIGCKNANA